MREQVDTIQNKGVSIIAVVPADSDQIKQFLKVYGPYPYKILGDPNLNAYKELPLKRVSIVKSVKIMSQYLFAGRIREIFPKDPEQMKIVKNAMFRQDVYQLGGTWLIDTSGEILWQHIDLEPADHATIPTILHVIDEFIR